LFRLIFILIIAIIQISILASYKIMTVHIIQSKFRHELHLLVIQRFGMLFRATVVNVLGTGKAVTIFLIKTFVSVCDILLLMLLNFHILIIEVNLDLVIVLIPILVLLTIKNLIVKLLLMQKLFIQLLFAILECINNGGWLLYIAVLK
jgi:hypothetical protein